MKRRVGILGMGRWGQTWLRILDDVPDARVTTVAARGRADEVRRRRPDLTVHDDYAALLAGEDVDAVVVALPVDDHRHAIELALSRSVPVLCEKPLVATRGDLAAVRDLVASTDVPVRVDQNYRHREWTRLVRTHIAQIGALRRVQIDFAQPEFTDGGRRELVHPLLADMTIHHMDLLRFITDAEARVLDAGVARRDDATILGATDVDARLTLDPAGDVVYRATWAAREKATPWDGDWLFEGERGTITVRDLSVRVEAEHASLVRQTDPPFEDDDLVLAWRDFARAVDGDPDAGVSVEEAALSQELVLDVAEAAGVPLPAARVSG